MNWLSTGIAIMACALAPAASADGKSEAFVAANADRVLQVLNDETLSDEQKRANFSQFMNEFADINAIALRVLGPTARTMTAAQLSAYHAAFADYAMAVYRKRLDQFRGARIKVVGSRDLSARNSHVVSMIPSSDAGEDVEVIWDVLESRDGTRYIVRDVALNIGGGSQYWLAVDQHENFRAFLSQNGNDIDKLIGEIRLMTVRVNAQIAARDHGHIP